MVMSKTIKELCREAYETAKEKGWHDTPATFGDRIALCHSELSEALEAYRSNDTPAFNPIEPLYRSTVTGRLTRTKEEYAPHLYDGPERLVQNKPEGVPSELADVCIRIFDLCGLMGIDLERAIDEKMAYNKTRPYRHGGKRL